MDDIERSSINSIQRREGGGGHGRTCWSGGVEAATAAVVTQEESRPLNQFSLLPAVAERRTPRRLYNACAVPPTPCDAWRSRY